MAQLPVNGNGLENSVREHGGHEHFVLFRTRYSIQMIGNGNHVRRNVLERGAFSIGILLHHGGDIFVAAGIEDNEGAIPKSQYWQKKQVVLDLCRATTKDAKPRGWLLT